VAKFVRQPASEGTSEEINGGVNEGINQLRKGKKMKGR
jgi:hypothetical protein